MKLKNQFVIFIAATILMPFFCISGIFVYSCLNNPERTILKDFYNAKETEDYGLSPESWETLKDIIEKRPPRARTAVIINHNKILFSDIPELSTGETISDRHFLRRMEITSKDYFFQFIPASLDKNENQALIITRLPRKSESKRARYNRFILTVVFTLSFFSLFTIAFIIVISTTISRSIEILEKNTERIANGELDVELKIPRTKGHKNEITSLTENLEKMRQTLKENEERRTRFIMGISHDLRTPVAVIKGYTEALSDGTLDNQEMKKNALEIIGTKTSQLESMIETLINYVKLNSSEWREQLVSQPIEKAIKEFAETAAVTGKLFKRKITTSIQIPENICIPFNRQLFNRALENIF
ncbi:MAG: HAMP domain-containing histidine kinase, partial [Treponema sp.]|nr:HAMP domain-containing histidine kinase [Treponema sp.]